MVTILSGYLLAKLASYQVALPHQAEPAVTRQRALSQAWPRNIAHCGPGSPSSSV